MSLRAAAAFGLLAISGLLIPGEEIGPQEPAAHDAISAWNQVVQAKGGRERLHSVKGFRATLRETVSRFTRYPELISKHTEKVFSLPDKVWEWYDLRPEHSPTDKPGHHFDARLWNTTECWKWLSSNGGRAHFESYSANCFPRRDYSEQLLLYMFETRDFRPTPVRASSAGRNRATIELEVPDFDSVTYVIDTRTNLPLEVVVVPLVRRIQDGTNDIVTGVPFRHTFGEFQDVAGIKMPTKLDGADVTVELDPVIDPRLFTTPPDGVADADAWREPTKVRTSNPARIITRFRDQLFGYELDIPRGYWATDVVDQQGFRIVSTWSNTVLLVSARWLPSGTLDQATDRWRAETLARFPNLTERFRRGTRLGGLEATEVVLADEKESADVNYARAVIAHRRDPGRNVAYIVELNQGIRPEQGDEILRQVTASFKVLSSR